MHRGVGCGVVNKGHICRFLKCILVVLDAGNERVDSMMCLCARFGAKLVRGESVVELGVSYVGLGGELQRVWRRCH